jgi:hypothetical protein
VHNKQRPSLNTGRVVNVSISVGRPFLSHIKGV